MSLTILFQTPVDTGTAKIRPKVENPNLKDFYLLTGKLTPVGLRLRRSVRLLSFDQFTRFMYIFIVIPSSVTFKTNSVLVTLITSNFHGSDGSISLLAIKFFVL